MSTVAQVRERLQDARSKILEIAGECMVDNKAAITALVVNQQYEQGTDGKNIALKPYSPPYKKRKEKLGVYQGHTDYSLTGKMHGEMELIVDGVTYEITSATQVNGYNLADLLKKRDNDTAFELTDENKVNAWEIIKPDFMTKLSEVSGLD